MSTVIHAEGLGKKYVLSHRRQSYVALRDVIADSAKATARRVLGQGGNRRIHNELTREVFWAMKDVSFALESGERLGIIGRNGAGKSTLLKVLSRITAPTEGRVRIWGRVASLLEVGTGFHPELSGRENIFLNGAILGMSRSEISRKFDAIVEFAEVERFLDTPVKHYSSGMYVRLAFSVAAHLEPEILIVDEVLAVGDAQFQRKCLGRMEEIGDSGRTILFVSHSMPTITSLCRRAILLDGGRVIEDGPVSNVVTRYYGQGSAATYEYKDGARLIGDEHAVLLGAKVLSESGEPSLEVSITDPVIIEMTFEVRKPEGLRFVPNLHFFRADGKTAFVTSDFASAASEQGVYVARCIIPANLLNDGTYFVGVAVASFERSVRVHFYELNALCFNVYDPIEGVPTRGGWSGPIEGALRPQLDWVTERGD